MRGLPEHLAACTLGLDLDGWLWLTHHGLRVDEPALIGGSVPLDRITGAARVSPAGHGLFEFDPEGGRPAVIQGVIDHDTGDLADLVAWLPRAPERWRLLRGDGLCLGWRDLRGPIHALATPASWLRWLADGGRGGVVLLRRDPAAARALFLDDDIPGRPVLTETTELGVAIDRLLRDPGPLPPIHVPAADTAAAV